MMLYGRNAINVDWKRLVICVAQPWTLPTANQLVDDLSALISGTEEFMGKVMIDKEKFMSTELWLECPQEDTVDVKDTQSNDDEGKAFDRTLAFKEVLQY